jgi:hypothetical protein
MEKRLGGCRINKIYVNIPANKEILSKGVNMEIELLLNPLLDQKTKPRRIVDAYTQAITEAKELYILTAFLTDWSPQANLNSKCEDLCFIVGTDFGLTKKDACRAVLNWLPRRHKCDFIPPVTLTEIPALF